MLEFLQQALQEVCYFCIHYTTEMLAISLLCAFHFPRRSYFWLRFVPAAALYLSFPYWMGYGPGWMTVGWFNLTFLFYFVLDGLLLWFCFHMSWRQALFFSTAAYAMQNCMDELTRVLLTAMQPLALRAAAELYVRTGVCILLTGAFYLLFARRLRGAEERFSVRNTSLIALSVVTVLIVYALSSFVKRQAEDDIYRSLYAVCCCLLLLLFQFGLFEKGNVEKKNEQIRRMLAVECEQHRLSKENIEAINLKCHDLKHQIAALRGMTDDERREAQLRSIEKQVMIYDSFVKTGNGPLDIVLTEKSLLCERYGIRLSCLVDAEGLRFLDEEDIYSLFGNALDNAVEAVKKAEASKRRPISLNVSVKGRVLVIHVDNYCGEKVTFRDGLPETTKGDKDNHGFGMLSIRYITEKYGGTLHAFLLDDMFHLNILIPFPHAGSGAGGEAAAEV